MFIFIYFCTHFVILLFIYCRLQYEATPKYLGESVTGIEIRIWNSCSSLCVVGKGKEVGDIGG